jgi:SAM-dependent methyltransferase
VESLDPFEASQLDAKIKFITTQYSTGVEREIEATTESALVNLGIAKDCQTVEEFCNAGLSSAPKEYSVLLQGLGENLKILDVGVGPGQSSAFLAMKGHRVWAVEPNPGFCRVLSYLRQNFQLDLTPVCAVGEELDLLTEQDFDVVIFNSSLHHCDNPVLALQKARELLKPQGKIFLCSESFLRPWVNKETWYRRLETHPLEMGHYGGNEHAYYSWEYRQMLKDAGFAEVVTLPSAQFLEPLFRIEFELKARDGIHRPRFGELEFLIRTLYYFAMSKVVKISLLFRVLSGFSLLPGQIRGTKA